MRKVEARQERHRSGDEERRAESGRSTRPQHSASATGGVSVDSSDLGEIYEMPHG